MDKPFIVTLSIENGDLPVRYVNVNVYQRVHDNSSICESICPWWFTWRRMWIRCLTSPSDILQWFNLLDQTSRFRGTMGKRKQDSIETWKDSVCMYIYIYMLYIYIHMTYLYTSEYIIHWFSIYIYILYNIRINN